MKTGYLRLEKTRLVDRRLPSPLDYGKIMMDIGCGANPYGNIQIDLLPDDSDKHHRGESVPPTVYADAHHLPFRPRVADRISYIHIIEHLIRPIDALKEGRRVSREDGLIKVSIPNPQLWKHERDEHLYSWHPDTFHNMMKFVGFKIKKYRQGGKNQSIEATV